MARAFHISPPSSFPARRRKEDFFNSLYSEPAGGAGRQTRAWRPPTVIGLVALLIGALPGGACTSNVAKSKGKPLPDTILAIFTPTTPAQAALWAVDPYDADKRYRGTVLLANAPFGGEPIYLDLYEHALTDSDSAVRAAAVRGLALHGSPRHVPMILPMLTDADLLLRWEAARALQRLHNPEAVTPLLARLTENEESEPQIRAAVASALGQYAEMRVMESLISALGDRDLTVNRAAQDSLRVLTGQDLGLNIRVWVAWRKAAADVFAGRTPYVYPVFYRDKNWLETIIPLWQPPNEVASTPVGLEGPGQADQ